MPNPQGFMCTISQDELNELKTLYYNRYKENLTDEQATDLGMHLLSLFSVVGKRLPNESLQSIDSSQQNANVDIT